jgi:pimeloyl-ACP methyl ester carboxylesterase
MFRQFKTYFWLLFVLLTCSNANAQSPDNSLVVRVVGTGRPIVFIPGYGCSGDVWNGLVGQFSDKFQCHIVYLPGFAGLPGFQTDSYLKDVKEKIAAYIQQNNLDKPIIAGHSLGGFLSLLLACEYPHLVGPIIDIDGLAFTPAIIDPKADVESQLPTAKQYFKFDDILLGTPNGQTDEQVKPYLLSMTNQTDKIDVLVEWTKKSDQRILNQSMYDMFTIDLRNEIKKIRSPILVFGTWIGYKSYGVTKESSLKSYQEQFKNAAHCTILISEAGRHFLMWDDEKWLQSEMLNFLSPNK